MDGIAEADVPRLVGELVARGGAIHAVVPTRHTLEERFMSLLAQDGAGGADRGRMRSGARATASGHARARRRPGRERYRLDPHQSPG